MTKAISCDRCGEFEQLSDREVSASPHPDIVLTSIDRSGRREADLCRSCRREVNGWLDNTEGAEDAVNASSRYL